MVLFLDHNIQNNCLFVFYVKWIFTWPKVYLIVLTTSLPVSFLRSYEEFVLVLFLLTSFWWSIVPWLLKAKHCQLSGFKFFCYNGRLLILFLMVNGLNGWFFELVRLKRYVDYSMAFEKFDKVFSSNGLTSHARYKNNVTPCYKRTLNILYKVFKAGNKEASFDAV